MRAVLTADIVNSTKLDPGTEKELIKELSKILRLYKFEFYRGDSFQVYIKEPQKAMEVALLCRIAAITVAGGPQESPLSDIRISIGLGAVKSPVKALATAKGDAFLLSGRSFDMILQATGRRLVMMMGKAVPDIALQAIGDYADAIYKGMTPKQAEVIWFLLRGETQQDAALALDKSKSTVSQLVNAGRWPEIERLLKLYEKLIKELL